MIHPEGAAAAAGAGAATMPVTFSFEPFNPAAGKFDRWLDRLQISFRIYKVANVNKRDYLLHYMGGAAYEILCNKLMDEPPLEKSYDQIVTILKNHFTPAPLEILENFKFQSRKQLEHETLSDYLMDLEKLAQTCNFEAHLNKAIRNQFVFGIRIRVIQSRLLEVRDLTLERAKEIAFGMEMSFRGTDEMHGFRLRPSADVKYIEHGKTKKKKSNNQLSSTNSTAAASSKKFDGQKRTCYRCGDDGHLADKCKYVTTKCKFCNKKGHLEKVCQSKRKEEMRKNDAHHLEEPYVVKDLFHLRSALNFSSKFMLNITVNKKVLTFEVDTGSPVSLIGSQDKQRYFPHLTLHPADLRLVSYCDNEISILGKIFVNVVANGDETLLPLHVADSSRHPLVGRNWLRDLNIDFNRIFKPGTHSMSHCSLVPEVTTTALKNILHKYPNVFNDRIGHISGVRATLTIRDNTKPMYIKARPVAFAVRNAVDKEIDKLVSDGIWEKVDHSNWATPVVPVQKAGGRVRLCGDYKITLNPNLLVDDHPLPTVEELFATVAGGQRFSKIDLSQAYLQLEVRREDRELLTLSTHRGLFRPTRLMYGVASAPAIFQRLMEQILQDIPGVTIFIDDIRVTGPDDRTHLLRLEEVLKRLDAHNMRANREKCDFFADNIEYCGYRIDRHGVHKLRSKIDAIENMPIPTSKEQIRSFIGLVSYYGRFFPNLSTILYPLNNLLKDDVPFKWSNACDKSFNLVKREMQTDRFLVHYDPTLPVILATDASPYGVGAVLSHQYPDGCERPLQYASQTLSRTQQRYSQIDKEAYAIIFGVRKFQQYLYGRKFTLITDNKPVSQIFSEVKGLPTMSAMRMQHYAAFLQAFDYSIRYRRSSDHCNADAMSRLPVATTDSGFEIEESDAVEINTIQTLPLTVDELGSATLQDKGVQELMRALRTGKAIDARFRFGINQEEFSLQKDCLMRGARVYVPPALRVRVLNELHSTHFGITRIKSLARGYCWWEGIDRDIENLIKSCASCQMNRANPPKISFHCWETPSEPFQRVHADYAGPFMGFYFLILIDAYSKWPEVRILRNMTTETTIRVCREFFSTFGIPSVFVSDNGPQFTSADFDKFLKMNGVVHKLSAPYHPATNGQAERFIQTMKCKLKSMDCNKSDLHSELYNILLSYRKMIHPTTGHSPAQMVFGRQLRSRLDLMIPSDDPKDSVVQGKVRDLTVGSRVSARNYDHSTIWEFGVIKERLGKLHYLVQLDDGRVWRRHIDQLRAVAVEEQDSSKEVTFSRDGGFNDCENSEVSIAVTPQNPIPDIPSCTDPIPDPQNSPKPTVAISPTLPTGNTAVNRSPGVQANQGLRRSARTIRAPQKLDL
ncbi:uncharacterized protein K02A2.6-like [Uranotaenia lowii]|uniref:uncharacterized protein K02A2.6-like n=1 Tax=Uranotaenia lowii TaxID=190385 RepID=UPI00247B02FE|nr:uncharacterized protein K02A2.6-like [Uranotaenia lowii]